jgi:integrase
MAVRQNKQRNQWIVDIRYGNGQRHRQYSPANSKKGAEAFEVHLRNKIARGESIVRNSNEEKKELSFEQFARQWFKQYVIPNNKVTEQYAKRLVLEKYVIPFFGKTTLKNVSTYQIERFKAAMAAKKLSNKTINNKLTVLGKCLRCAHEWYGTNMPMIKLLRCATPKTNYLTSAESDLLLSTAEGQLQEMLLMALRTGMRQGEIRGLQWSSIDWQNRSIAVRHSQDDRSRSLTSPKSHKERHIPMDSDLYEILFRRKKDSGYVFWNTMTDVPFTTQRLIEDLQIHCKKAGVRKIGWHVLRHTFATQLGLGNVPITVTKELLGHSSIITTMRYSHVGNTAMRSAIEILNPRNAQFMDFGQQMGNKRSGNDDVKEAFATLRPING